VLRILCGASATIAEGEVLQLVIQNDTSSTEEQYLDVIEGKTAALFAAATRVGAVVADRPQAEAEALDAYGRNLGIAFQLVDDALDYSAKQETLGKTVGDDFREGKITLPVLLAFARGDEAERGFWKRVLEERQQDEADLPQALELMQRHHAFEDTIARARDYGDRAIAALAGFPDNPEKQALANVVEFCIARAR
jgi:octaprenyl-diphosphate synthase